MVAAAATPAVTAPVVLRNVLRENFGDTIYPLDNAWIRENIFISVRWYFSLTNNYEGV
jgi:hypothetical protein